jgi:DNA repair exonuclease SbcCD nuclease subunit
VFCSTNMKILIFSDLHIHPHKKSSERLKDCLNALDWVFSVAEERRVRNLVFLGDLFHDRQKIDVLAYQRTFEILERRMSSKMFRLDLLLGNHDLWHYERLDVSSVNPLRSIEGIRVIDSPSVVEITDGSDSFQMGFLPYTHSPVEDIATLDRAWKDSDENKARRVLGGHIAVDGAVWNVRHNTLSDVVVEHEGDMVRVGPEIFKKWDRVFLGHYHAAQKMDGKVEYVGSPLQLSFGEADQKKHVLIYDTENDSVEYVENKFSPKHLIINESQVEDPDLKGNFVRLEVDNIAGSEINKIRNDLINELGVSTLEIKQKAKNEAHVIEDAKAIFSNEDEMIERYVEQVSPEGLDRDALIKIGSEICKISSEL